MEKEGLCVHECIYGVVNIRKESGYVKVGFSNDPVECMDVFLFQEDPENSDRYRAEVFRRERDTPYIFKSDVAGEMDTIRFQDIKIPIMLNPEILMTRFAHQLQDVSDDLSY